VASDGAESRSTGRSRSNRLLLLSVAAAVLLADQLTKLWALRELADGSIHLFWTIRLRLVFNQGTAFGLGSSLAPVITVAAVVVSLLLLRLTWSTPRRSDQSWLSTTVAASSAPMPAATYAAMPQGRSSSRRNDTGALSSPSAGRSSGIPRGSASLGVLCSLMLLLTKSMKSVLRGPSQASRWVDPTGRMVGHGEGPSCVEFQLAQFRPLGHHPELTRRQ